MTFADGKPYVNNLDCFGNLCLIGGIARALNEVKAAQFTDRRNPDPVINVEPRVWEAEPGIEIDEPDWLLPSLPRYTLTVGSLRIPKPTVKLGHSVAVLLSTYGHLSDEFEDRANIDAEAEIREARSLSVPRKAAG